MVIKAQLVFKVQPDQELVIRVRLVFKDSLDHKVLLVFKDLPVLKVLLVLVILDHKDLPESKDRLGQV
jgi:hypothetical protein